MKILKYTILSISLYVGSTLTIYFMITILTASHHYSITSDVQKVTSETNIWDQLLRVYLWNLMTYIVSIFSGFSLGRIFILILILLKSANLAFILSQVPGDILHKVLIFGILPHSVFEVTALCLSWSLGLILAECENWKCFKHVITKCWKVLVTILLLLIIAAYIEVCITPKLLHRALTQ